MKDKNKSNDTLFTLLMRNGCSGGLEATHDFAKARRMLFGLLAKHAKATDLPQWFNVLMRQLLEPNACNLTSRSMKELIDLASDVQIDFACVLTEHDTEGNHILMDLAKNMKDDALREILTNSSTTNYVRHIS